MAEISKDSWDQLHATVDRKSYLLVQVNAGMDGKSIFEKRMEEAMEPTSKERVSVEALMARITKMEDEIAEAEDREAEDARMWEGDCAREIKRIANAMDFEWEPDGNTADAIGEHILECWKESEAWRKRLKDAATSHQRLLNSIHFQHVDLAVKASRHEGYSLAVLRIGDFQKLEAELAEARAALSGRTVSCSGCNEMAGKPAEAWRLAVEAMDLSTNHAAGLIPQTHIYAFRKIAALAAKEQGNG